MLATDTFAAQRMDATAASVTIEGLVKSFGGVVVIPDLSVSFQAGTISVLLGSSGCGKTTILRCIAGLEEPSGGDIVIHDRTVFSARQRINIPPERRDLGMVFQSYAIWPHMTVHENVALPLRAHGVSNAETQARVRDLLKLVGLDGLGDRNATQLSGGQQQRVAIARCLANQPKLILLDEPLSNLDAKLRVAMRSELRELQRRLNATRSSCSAAATWSSADREPSFTGIRSHAMSPSSSARRTSSMRRFTRSAGSMSCARLPRATRSQRAHSIKRRIPAAICSAWSGPKRGASIRRGVVACRGGS
jgi:ABC-type nitrate/sulfonate/bicarbonate transport system ATPase subunit